MPFIFSNLHDKILSTFNETNEMVLSDIEQNLFGKIKNSYSIPINMIIKPIFHQLKGDIEYFGIIKKEKTLKNLAYVFCDLKGIINDISASAISILGLNFENISLNFINID